MTLGAIAEFGAGLLIAGYTLLDVFSTILVPGPSNAGLRAASRLAQLGLPLARRLSRTSIGPGTRPTNSFAPLLFLFVALLWLLMLLFGFGMMMHAVSGLFAPRLEPFSQALYVAGSSLLTLGVSEVDASGIARWLLLAAALAGFGVVTATISFIMQIQSGLHQREPKVLALAGIAGAPPSGLTILLSFAELDVGRELARFFDEWRDWSAGVLHSHVSYPVLAHFHSADAESDWLSALAAVLDAATMVMTLTESDATGAATMMHRTGSRTASALCDAFEMSPVADNDGAEAIDAIVGKLAAAGYVVRRDRAAMERFVRLRGDYAPRIRSLAEHLGADRARLPRA